MPLSPEDKATLIAKIIANYGLSAVTGINSMVQLAVELSDGELEERYPSAYVATLTGSTINQKKFILVRELYAVYLLFKTNPIAWGVYSQSQGVSSVKNSAGSSVSFRNANEIRISDYALQVQGLLIDLGLIEQKSVIVFNNQSNSLV